MMNQPYQQNWFGMQGMQYAPQNQAPQPPVLNNFLTPEIIAGLQRNPSFVVKLTPDEYNKGICTHKLNNTITLQNTADGKQHCTSCTEDFHLLDLDLPDDYVEQICENMFDLLQSIKTYMLNVPEDFKSLYMVTGLIKKFPQLWKVAKKSFEQAVGQTAFGMNQTNDNSFQVLGSIFGNNGMNGMMNPMSYNPNAYGPQMPFQQPMYQNQQFMYQNQYSQPQYNNGYMQQPMYQNQYPQQPVWNQQQPQYNPPPGYVQQSQQQPMYQNQYSQQPPQPPVQNPIGYIDPNQQMASNVQIPITPQPAQTSVRVEDVQPVINQNNPNVQSPATINNSLPNNPNIKK